MTETLLNTVRKIAMNSRVVPDNMDSSTLEPPLRAFIGFLTFERRQEQDAAFMRWLKEYYTGMTFVSLFG
jgi:hypothetical protein